MICEPSALLLYAVFILALLLEICALKITWHSVKNVDSDVQGLVGSLRFCIYTKLVGRAHFN